MHSIGLENYQQTSSWVVCWFVCCYDEGENTLCIHDNNAHKTSKVNKQQAQMKKQQAQHDCVWYL